MFDVAVVGATGAVGTDMLRVLEERGFPVTELRPLASERSEGRELDYLGRPRTVRRLTADAFEGIQIALFSAGGDPLPRVRAGAAVEAGAVVIDNSSAYRMDPAVPLVVPEVNEHDLEGHGGIVANPNCVAAPLVVALKPIADAVGLERVIVSSYQSVSGTGQAAVDRAARPGGRLPRRRRAGAVGLPAPDRLQRPAAHRRLRRERLHRRGAQGRAPRRARCWACPTSRVSATCVRVPVLYAHSQSVQIETTDGSRPTTPASLLMAAPGVVLVDEPQLNRYPLPRDAAGRDDVLVGRIREDSSHDRGLVLWVVSDNLRKGAATNAVQIAESLVTRGWL